MTRVMLDNMVSRKPSGDLDVSLLKQAVDLIGGKVETEVRKHFPILCETFRVNNFYPQQASGNVTLETVGQIGATGVTFISR